MFVSLYDDEVMMLVIMSFRFKMMSCVVMYIIIIVYRCCQNITKKFMIMDAQLGWERGREILDFLMPRK